MAEWSLDFQYLASLVVRAQKGDSDAFAELYAATYKQVYSFACRYLHDESFAEDATQDTYITAFQKLGTLNNPNLFVAWIKQITFRACLRIQQKNAKALGNISLEELPEDIQSNIAQPEDVVVEVDQRSFLMRQIMSLPFSESQVLILHYYNGMKIEEVAKLLEISRSTVKRYLLSGKRKLALLVER